MADLELDLLWVRSTDPYLNEYVPPALATRAWLTGFRGSMGEALVGTDRAWLCVDGRYWLQAEAETDPGDWTVVRVQASSGLDGAVLDRIGQVAKERGRPVRVGVEADRITLKELEKWRQTRDADAVWIELDPSPVASLRAQAERDREGLAPLEGLDGPLRWVGPEHTGHDAETRLQRLFEDVDPQIQGLWVHRLDDVAYLTGLRGQGLPFQSTFRGAAVALRDRIWVGLDGPVRTPSGSEPDPRVEILSRTDFEARVATLERIGCDPDHTTVAAWNRLGPAALRQTLGLGPSKARKSPRELAFMKDAFARADRVMASVIRYVCERVEAGDAVSEKDVAEQVEARFLEAGAYGLSFRVIAAAGTNGAIIHYGTPNPERFLERGELMLIDTGAYFEAGYATDLTRTFLVGGALTRPSERQRTVYTAVLRAAIAGMRARIPAGANGAQLDGIVRSPLWEAGMDYAHGTGHGVGINVHEYPPRVSGPVTQKLEVGHVFSIEPGWYDPDFGGVRIENLCTVVPDPEHPGFLRVEPLTFAPLDLRLVDRDALRPDERRWLDAYVARSPDA